MHPSMCLLFFALRITLSTMAAGRVERSEIPSVSDYFDLKDDATKLTWAHAVNSQELLKKAVADPNVMMLEADVVMGTVEGASDVVPIMAHPPANVSDLSLEKFVNSVIQIQKTEKKGMKLDFKSIDAFSNSLTVLYDLRDNFTFPLWLNADILKGPVDSQTVPVDADKFLKSSASQFPTSTLSLGWTTRYGPNITGPYTDKQLKEMEEVIIRNGVVQPVTLAVRAGIVARSAIGIRSLVDKINGIQKSNATTLTIWMSTDTDPVDVAELKNLILTMGKSRVFLDVPEAIRNQLDSDISSGKTPVSGALGAFVAVLTSVSALFTNAFKLFD